MTQSIIVHYRISDRNNRNTKEHQTCSHHTCTAPLSYASILSLSLASSDGVKDIDGKAKAKDISHEAKTKAKDIQHKPKSLCHGDLSLWRDVMSESSYWHTRIVTKTHH